MYNGYYSPQASMDRINSQIAELEKLKQQISQPTSINQTFQLAPTTGIKHAESIEQVQKEIVSVDTPYFSKDMSVLWLKKASGDLKTYELKEIVEKDEKDLKIEFLMARIEEMEKEVNNGKSNDESTNESSKSKKSSNVSESTNNDGK